MSPRLFCASKQSGQDGYVIITTAVLLVVLLAFAALAVDVGMFYSSRAGLQRAADAAALAGAFSFVSNPSAVQPQTAQEQSLNTALSNEVFGTRIKSGEVTVNVDVGSRRVTVNISRAERAFFAGVLGATSANIGVRAIAEASANALASYCTKPWFVANTMLSELPPCDACTAGEVLMANGLITPFGQSKIGTGFRVKPGQPENALAPGQFYCIRLGTSTGGSDYENNISKCASQVISCGMSYGVEPGNKIGPTKQGVTGLIGNNPDEFVALGQYRRPDQSVWDTSRSLIVVPIWSVCDMAGFCPAGQLPNGGANVTIPVVGFALLFIDGLSGNDVLAHLVGVFPCGDTPPGSAPGETGPFSVLVRLVRLP
ncbi:MAG: hypothetical protein EHM61_00595 [Acidobacteria bacterium]|nr:MAG: hypothetical protein EHM61_00595 [Acidobacteriota bacterium]